MLPDRKGASLRCVRVPSEYPLNQGGAGLGKRRVLTGCISPLQEHVQGKQYLGWSAIRDKLKELQGRFGHREPERHREPDRHRSKDMDRERERPRDQGRDRDRDRDRERDRHRDR